MQDRPRDAALCVLAAMAVIGAIDQAVILIAEASSLWTFHLLRSAMIGAMAAAWLAVTGRRIVLHRRRAVAARSVAMSCAMILYFGALGFLPVAQAAAGLFTAPLWVVVIGALAFRRPPGRRRTAAAGLGFVGVTMVLAPDPSALGWTVLAPVAAGAFYALAALATRGWCDGESASTLALGVFGAMAVWGLCGVIVVEAIGPGDGYLTRGWITPDAATLGWIALQAVGSLLAVVLLTRGYQLADASVASVFEYSVLGFSAAFGAAIWGDRLDAWGMIGLVLIAVAGWAAGRSPGPAAAQGRIHVRRPGN